MHRIKRDCYADTKNISGSENWQLQIGNGFDVSRSRTAKSRGFHVQAATQLSCDLRLALRDNFARVSRCVFLETWTNRVSSITRGREIGSSCYRLPSLRCHSLDSSALRIMALQFRSTPPPRHTVEHSSESCKQASILGYTLPAVAQS